MSSPFCRRAGNIPSSPGDLKGANSETAHFTLSSVTISQADVILFLTAACAVLPRKWVSRRYPKASSVLLTYFPLGNIMLSTSIVRSFPRILYSHAAALESSTLLQNRLHDFPLHQRIAFLYYLRPVFTVSQSI